MRLFGGPEGCVCCLGLALVVDSSSQACACNTDGLGSVREVSSGSGAIVATYQTDAFGNPLAAGGTFSQPFQFTGQQSDPTGLCNLRARLYDPATGRFMQQDPLFGNSNDPRSRNRYTCTQNDPAARVDRSGMVAPVMQDAYNPALGGLASDPSTGGQANSTGVPDCLDPSSRLFCSLIVPGPGGLGLGILRDMCELKPFLCPEGGAGPAPGNDDVVTLYRVVDPAELEDIVKTGGFRAGPGTMETKLFATSLQDAKWWGQRLHPEGGFQIMEVRIPRSISEELYHGVAEANPAREFVAVDPDQLGAFNAAAQVQVVR